MRLAKAVRHQAGAAWDDAAKWWECKQEKEVRGRSQREHSSSEWKPSSQPSDICSKCAGRSNSCEKLATVLSAGEFLVRLTVLRVALSSKLANCLHPAETDPNDDADKNYEEYYFEDEDDIGDAGAVSGLWVERVGACDGQAWS